MRIKDIARILIVVASLVFSFWLAIGVMLVGGIEQAAVGFAAGDISMGVWGVVRAIFFEMGFLPFWIGYIVAIMMD